MTNLSIIEAPELKSIEPSKAEIIRQTFAPMADMLDRFESKFDEVMAEKENGVTKELTGKAKRLRIDIGKVRIETEKTRKAQKGEYLRAGQAIDGVSNLLKWAVSDKEEKLKKIEKHFEIEEQKRLEKLQLERVEMLSLYADDANERALSALDQDTFEALLSTKKQQLEDHIAAEKKAEAERIAKDQAEAEERARIAAENERLKAEAAERERLAEIEREKLAKAEAARKKREAAERKKREDAERKQREEYEAKLKAEREEAARKADIERAERERLAEGQRIEQEKREKLEAQIDAEKAAEKKRKEEESRRMHDAELQRNNRAEMLIALSEISTGNRTDAELLVDAIIAGKIPHVKYVG